jgi:hypothetical protein
VKTARIGLLIVAAMAFAAPLAAQDRKTPDPLQRSLEMETVSSAMASPQIPAEPPLLAQAQQTAPPAPNVAEKPSIGQPAPGQADPNAQLPSAPLAPQPSAQDTEQREKAEQQIKQQEHQRVLGVLPSFNVSYDSNAVSLTGWQKIRLAFRTSIDPVTFGVAFLVAGYHEGMNDVGFGWGIKGYGQRAGAAYLDTFDGNMIGNGILPALLHQDPRYFRLGQGTVRHRLLYAASTAFVCKHDNTGKWEPNYSNVGGNIASGALSNLYYPGTNSGVGLTISNGLIQTAEGAAGSIFQEFWPDISRHLFHKDPTHGKDVPASNTANPGAQGTDR